MLVFYNLQPGYFPHNSRGRQFAFQPAERVNDITFSNILYNDFIIALVLQTNSNELLTNVFRQSATTTATTTTATTTDGRTPGGGSVLGIHGAELLAGTGW